MHRLLFIVLLLPAIAAGQKIYKHVDTEGNVSYSDEPMSEDAVAMDLPPLSVVETRRPEVAPRSEAGAPTDADSEAETNPYTDVRIVQPSPEENLHGTGNQVGVGVRVIPALQQGHSLRYLLDGAVVAETSSQRVRLTEVFRGQHSVAAQIVDAQGKVVTSTSPVVFYMMQPSILNPNSPIAPANNAGQRPRNRSGG